MNKQVINKIKNLYRSHRGGFGMLVAMMILFSIFSVPVRGVVAGDLEIEPESADLTWQIYNVDTPKYFTNMTDRSMQFDTTGKPHVAYGGDHLYYAWFDGSNWVRTVIDDSPMVGQYASLALDNSNNPRIAYYDGSNRALKFAYYMNGIWYKQTLETPTTLVTEASAPEPVLDPVYAQGMFDRSSSQDSESLLSSTVADNLDALTGLATVGKHTSIAVGGDNIVHISYYIYDGTYGMLKYATWDGVTWGFDIVDHEQYPSKESDVGLWTSIAVNSANVPSISYMSEKYDDLKYAKKGGSGWDVTNVSEETGRKDNLEGVFTSLVIDVNGNPHISYLDFTTAGNYKLRHAYINKGAWNTESVDSGVGIGYDTSIARNSDSTQMTISYYDAKNGKLKYATGNSGNWSTHLFDDGFNVGNYTSVDYDTNNRQGISFYSQDNGGYYFRKWNGNAWDATLIDTSGNVGISTSLDISNGSFPHIAYFNDVGDNLKYATSVGELWYTRDLVASGTVGEYSSLKLDANTKPHIAYYDRSKGDLMFIEWYGAWSEPKAIDSSEADVGQYVSMVIDNIGRYHVSYYDNTNCNLKYAYWNGSSWSTKTLEEGNCGNENSYRYEGLYTSIDVDTSNRPYIAYVELYKANKDTPVIAQLKYAYLSPTNVWLYEFVDKSGDAGYYASLAISKFNQSQISYYDKANGNLKFAYKSGNVWNFEVIDSTDDVGMYSSLAIDNNLVLHVSYYDLTNGNLKYAVKPGGTWLPEIVDSSGDVGLYSSLALTPSGEPGISYYDRTQADMKFAASYTLPTLKTVYAPIIMKPAE